MSPQWGVEEFGPRQGKEKWVGQRDPKWVGQRDPLTMGLSYTQPFLPTAHPPTQSSGEGALPWRPTSHSLRATEPLTGTAGHRRYFRSFITDTLPGTGQ